MTTPEEILLEHEMSMQFNTIFVTNFSLKMTEMVLKSLNRGEIEVNCVIAGFSMDGQASTREATLVLSDIRNMRRGQEEHEFSFQGFHLADGTEFSEGVYEVQCREGCGRSFVLHRDHYA